MKYASLGFAAGLLTGLIIAKYEADKQYEKDNDTVAECIHRPNGSWYIIRAPMGTLYCVDIAYLK